jgi:hypothetical protein
VDRKTFVYNVADPTKKELGKNKLVVSPFLVENYLVFLTATEKDLSQLTQN